MYPAVRDIYINELSKRYCWTSNPKTNGKYRLPIGTIIGLYKWIKAVNVIYIGNRNERN